MADNDIVINVVVPEGTTAESIVAQIAAFQRCQRQQTFRLKRQWRRLAREWVVEMLLVVALTVGTADGELRWSRVIAIGCVPFIVRRIARQEARRG